MSEAVKVDEPVVATDAAPVLAAEPTVEAPAAVEAAPETAAVEATEPAAEATEPAAAAVEEVKPVEEGVLGYKGPGLLKSFIFQKKFFFFGTEPVDSKHLASYLRGEKPEAANKNAAWASHTGKGLLFFTKKAAEKANPAGIINLSEISDIKTEGSSIFYFTVAGHKHTFEAANAAERDNWVATLKTQEAAAKEIAPTVTESETYKTSHSALSKPVLAAVAAVIPKKSTEAKPEAKAEDKTEDKAEDKAEDKTEPKEEKKEEKKEKARKSRSASRKRTSIFGAIPGFGKKEEKTEVAEEAAAPAAETTEAAVEPAAETTAEPAVEAAAEPIAEAEPVAAAEEAAPVETPTKPAASKRNSIFGTIKSQFSNKDKKPEAEAPVVPAKDTEPVAETAPVIPAVESTEPLAASVDSPAAVPAETAAVTEGEAAAPETPVAATTKAEKRKSSLPWLSKKEKASTTDDEAEKEKPLSPFAKLRATVKGKSPKVEKAAEPAAEPAAAAEAAATEAAPAAVEETIVAEPIPVATAQVSATA